MSDAKSSSPALSPDEIETALAALPGWRSEENHLVREVRFPSFRDAVAWIVRISFEAERLNHHPELLNTYASVRVRLCTHDAGGVVTGKDVELARAMEHLLPSSVRADVE